MNAGTAPLLIDVREPWEHQIVNIESAKLISMNTIPEHMEELDKNAEIIVHCHHGQRSWNVAAYLMQHGFSKVKNLTGGIDSWARRVDKAKRHITQFSATHSSAEPSSCVSTSVAQT